MTERTPKFLLVRLGSLGDVIHAIPSAAALRARYPDAQIDWLVDPRYTSVLQLVDGLNDAIPHADQAFGVGVGGIVAVDDGNFITMAHGAQNLEQFRPDEWIDAFEHS